MSNQQKNKSFSEYVADLRQRVERFKNSQQFVYCYMNERIDLAVELHNGGAYIQAWHLYRKISAEVAELMGKYQQPKRTKYFYKGKQ
jgi:hypothetical protein